MYFFFSGQNEEYENTREAFYGLFKGENLGKAIVRCNEVTESDTRVWRAPGPFPDNKHAQTDV